MISLSVRRYIKPGIYYSTRKSFFNICLINSRGETYVVTDVRNNFYGITKSKDPFINKNTLIPIHYSSCINEISRFFKFTHTINIDEHNIKSISISEGGYYIGKLNYNDDSTEIEAYNVRIFKSNLKNIYIFDSEGEYKKINNSIFNTKFYGNMKLKNITLCKIGRDFVLH